MHVSRVFLGLNVSHKDMQSGLFGAAGGGFGELLQLLTGLASEQLWGSQPFLCLVPSAPLGSLRHQGQEPEGTVGRGEGCQQVFVQQAALVGASLSHVISHNLPLCPVGPILPMPDRCEAGGHGCLLSGRVWSPWEA